MILEKNRMEGYLTFNLRAIMTKVASGSVKEILIYLSKNRNALGCLSVKYAKLQGIYV